jgi:hypothetical protein
VVLPTLQFPGFQRDPAKAYFQVALQEPDGQFNLRQVGLAQVF